jgi:hypothetical protein
MEEPKDFFEKYGLEVATGEVEVGHTYPIYGMITQFLSDIPGEVIVQLNFTITANMAIPDGEKIEVLKQRAFEPGIFISTVTSKEPAITVDCSTVVFGRKNEHHA